MPADLHLLDLASSSLPALLAHEAQEFRVSFGMPMASGRWRSLSVVFLGRHWHARLNDMQGAASAQHQIQVLSEREVCSEEQASRTYLVKKIHEALSFHILLLWTASPQLLHTSNQALQ